MHVFDIWLVINQLSQGGKTFGKSQMYNNWRIVPLNRLGGTTFPQVFASKSSSDSLNCDQEGATESASHVYFLSLSLQIATKFGTRGLGNRMPVLPDKKFDFFFDAWVQ